MGYDLLESLIDQFGYFALFLVLCLGLIGLPIPNEAVIMTGGALAATELLAPLPAYLMTWLGICSAMTFNYGLGRFTGNRLSNWFQSKNNLHKFMGRSEKLIHSYGGYAITISLCFPFVRHATPYVTGINRLPFRTFALFAYPSAFVWTLLYFYLGTLFGDNIKHIGHLVSTYGAWIVCIIAVIAAVYIVSKRKQLARTPNKDIDQSL